MTTPEFIKVEGQLYRRADANKNAQAAKAALQQAEELADRSSQQLNILVREAMKGIAVHEEGGGLGQDFYPNDRALEYAKNIRDMTMRWAKALSDEMYQFDVQLRVSQNAYATTKKSARFNGVLYHCVDASHPIEDTDGVPLSDQGKKGEPAVQKAIKDSQQMYFTQKGSGDKKKPKETGINPDLDKNHPGGGLPAAFHDSGDGGGSGGDGGGGDGGGGE